MNKKELSMEQFGAMVMSAVRTIGTTFTKPDDDWDPVVQVQTGNGEIVLFTLDPGFFATEMHKDLLADKVLPAQIDAVGGKKLAMVTSMWMVDYEGMPEEKVEEAKRRIEAGVRPSEHPDRIEAVQVIVLDENDAQAYIARIERDGKNPPTLGEFSNPLIEGMVTVTGRFVEPLQAALRASDGTMKVQL